MNNKMSIQDLKENPIEISKKLSIKSLEEVISLACKKYYEDDCPLIGDSVYDILIDELEKRDSKNDLLTKIGFKSKQDKIELPYFMGSMDKIKTKDQVKNWIYKFVDEQDLGFVISSKLDGLSGLYTYDNNTKNENLFTRGNSTHGRNINNIIKYLDLPKINQNIVLRGEIIISKENYEKYGTNYNSPRGMVVGLVAMKDDNELKKCLDFVIFEVIEPKLNIENQFDLVRKLGYKIPNLELSNFKNFLQWDQNNSFVLSKLNEYRKKSKYEIDGIIISHNKYYERINRNPKHSIAFKANNLGKVTTIREIIWNASKYNVLIPRIKFDKIDLGSNVEYCTGFSAKYIFNNCLGPGSKIRVVLSGDIIPYISEIITNTHPQMPKINYKWNENKIHIIAQEDGADLELKKIVHFIKCVNIDYLSFGIIGKLFKNGFNSLEKILTITEKDLLSLEGFKETNSKKIYTSINKVVSKPIDLGSLMVASLKFNHGMGYKKINKILEKYPNIMNQTPSHEQIINIEGFQTKTATQFLDNFDSFKKFLKDLNLKYFVSKQINSSKEHPKITGKNFVLTGTRDKTVLNFISEYGGILQNDININTNYLIVKDKDSNSSKVKKAKILGTNIISVDQFNMTINDI